MVFYKIFLRGQTKFAAIGAYAKRLSGRKHEPAERRSEAADFVSSLRL